MYVFVVLVFNFWVGVGGFHGAIYNQYLVNTWVGQKLKLQEVSRESTFMWREQVLKGMFLHEHAKLEIIWTLLARCDFIVVCGAVDDAFVFYG